MGDSAMMGRQTGDRSQQFYLFNLEERIPVRHLLRRINPIVTRVLAELREKLEPFYSEVCRPSIDPKLMLRMLIVGHCYGIRRPREQSALQHKGQQGLTLASPITFRGHRHPSLSRVGILGFHLVVTRVRSALQTSRSR
ncbi:MAG: transposase [Methylocella sp.]